MSEHLAAIGRIVFCWNVIENSFRRTLTEIVGGEQKVDIILTHVGSNTWLDAMRTISHYYLPREEKEGVLHAIKVFETLREYRNYYIYGFSEVRGTIDESTYWAGMRLRRARGQYFFEESVMTIKELTDFSVYLSAASNYYARLSLFFRYKDDNESENGKRYGTLPERLPIPSRLSKSRRDIELRDTRSER